MRSFVSTLLACVALGVPSEPKGKSRPQVLSDGSKPTTGAPEIPTFHLENDWPDSFYEGELKQGNIADKMKSEYDIWLDKFYEVEKKVERINDWPAAFYKGELKGGMMADAMKRGRKVLKKSRDAIRTKTEDDVKKEGHILLEDTLSLEDIQIKKVDMVSNKGLKNEKEGR